MAQINHEHIRQTLTQFVEKLDDSYHVLETCWQDPSRSMNSCWGDNIADVRLVDQKRRPIYTVRKANFDEHIGSVSARQIALVVGNETRSILKRLTPVTLWDYLKQFGTYASYAGASPSTSLLQKTDERIGVRFQTVFVPCEVGETLYVTPTVYSYGTSRKDDPQNLILMASPQGTSVQQDGPGQEKMFLHQVMPNGEIKECWTQVGHSHFAVGADQVETKESLASAQKDGLATAMNPIGIKAMGHRANVVMMLQIPLKPLVSYGDMAFSTEASPIYKSLPLTLESKSVMRCAGVSYRGGRGYPQGKSFAARMSVGHVERIVHKTLTTDNLTRHETQHPTLTITMYYGVKGGVPQEADVEAALKDLQGLYQSLGDSQGPLFEFGPKQGFTDTTFSYELPDVPAAFPE